MNWYSPVVEMTLSKASDTVVWELNELLAADRRITYKSFQLMNRYRIIHLAAVTGTFAVMKTDPATYGGEWILF